MGSHVLVRGNPALKALDSRTWLSFFIYRERSKDMSKLTSKHKESKDNSATGQMFTTRNLWITWLLNSVMAWAPLLVVRLVHKEPWHIILALCAIYWLMSTAKTVRLTPNTRYYRTPLLIGGGGIAILCFLTHGQLIANTVSLLVAVLFIATPSYAKFVHNEESKSNGDN
jgi:hypothetical protein